MPSSPPFTALCEAVIFTSEAMVEGHALLIKDGKIVDIVTNTRVPADAKKISCPDRILAPGFIDAQVNGGGNVLFNAAPTPEAGIAIAGAHRKHGTMRLLLTCITDKPDITQKAVTAMRAARAKEKSVLGIHIEGPHLSVTKRGVHKAEYVRALTPDDLRLYKKEGDEIMLATVAPENVKPEDIKALRNQGVIVSLGHTAATAEQTRNALQAGATGFTHLFNGMAASTARDPGPVGVALDDTKSWCSLIADGHHLSAESTRLALHAKPKGKVFLVSDAMPPAASDDPKPFELYGETIRVENGRCVSADGRLAGSAITLLDAVRHCVMKIGVGLEEALRMASTYPAAFLGIDSRLGKLLPGYEADVIALDAELNLKGIYAGNF